VIEEKPIADEAPSDDAVRTARRAVDPASDRVAATRARLIDAAERLFLAHGYDDVSVRTINAEAGLNPGAVHYHFGSKRGLVAALLEDRLLPDWGRVSRSVLDEIDAGDPPDMARIVERAVDPLLALVRQPGRGQLHARLLAMIVLGGWEVAWTSEAFSIDRWLVEVQRAAPHVPPETLRTRWELAVTLMLERIGRPLDDTPTAGGARSRADARGPQGEVHSVDRDELVAFIAGGLTAPVATRARRAKRPPRTTART
jgi:AcrR family transcriptional regulator